MFRHLAGVTRALVLLALGISAGVPLAAAGPPAADAADNSDQAFFCALVENLGNGSMNGVIKSEIDRRYNGWEIDIRGGKRKTLTMGQVDTVWFKGCRMTVSIEAEMERKIRRDARGMIFVDSIVRNMRLDRRAGTGRGCVRDTRVNMVDMSKTTMIGEAIYRRVANKMIERDLCFDFALP